MSVMLNMLSGEKYPGSALLAVTDSVKSMGKTMSGETSESKLVRSFYGISKPF